MSYDLAVFDPADAPRDHKHFLKWFGRATDWSEGHSYDDPAGTAPGLRAWFDDIRQTYPPMNGPLASHDDDSLRVTDYSIGHHLIYAAFAWSQAEDAYPLVRSLAVKHAVGFYDASGNGEIYFPGDKLGPPSGGAWRDIARDSKEAQKQ